MVKRLVVGVGLFATLTFGIAGSAVAAPNPNPNAPAHTGTGCRSVSSNNPNAAVAGTFQYRAMHT